MTPPNPIDMTNNKKDFANIVVFCIFVALTGCRLSTMLNDIYPFGMVGSLLRHPIGVFLFMKNTYTTQTRVDKNHCVIEVYINHQWWHTYDFHLDQLYFINGRNIFTNLGDKNWGTPSNLHEIHNEVMKHLLLKQDGNF